MATVPAGPTGQVKATMGPGRLFSDIHFTGGGPWTNHAPHSCCRQGGQSSGVGWAPQTGESTGQGLALRAITNQIGPGAQSTTHTDFPPTPNCWDLSVRLKNKWKESSTKFG